MDMKAYLNNKEIEIFRGATIHELLMAYSLRSTRMVKEGKWLVIDRFGNQTETDAPVSEGQHFMIKQITKK
jgi:hypothetical protein